MGFVLEVADTALSLGIRQIWVASFKESSHNFHGVHTQRVIFWL
jgi:hypothetical protein